MWTDTRRVSTAVIAVLAFVLACFR